MEKVKRKMSKLDDMGELGDAWCNEVQFAKLIDVARAAQSMMEWENIKREDIDFRGLELTSIVDPYRPDIHSTYEALNKALVSLEEEDEVKVLEKLHGVMAGRL